MDKTFKKDRPVKNKLPLWIDAALCTLFTCAVTGLLYLLLINISFFNVFEKAFRDFEFTDLYYAKGMGDQPVPDNIVLVNVQHADRSEIAQAIERVARQHPKVMALDMIFRELKDPQSDSLLRATLRRHSNIVMAYYKEGDGMVKSHEYFVPDPGNAGFINLYPKADQTVIRETLGLEITGNQDTLYSFAVQIASQYDPALRPGLRKLDALFPIDYTGNQENFFTFDLDELGRDEPLAVMEDAIVIFGYLGTPTGNEYDIEDKHFTPLNPEITGKSAPDMHGMVIHANIVRMLVHDGAMLKVSRFWTYTIAVLLCLVTVFFGLKFHRLQYVFYDVMIKVIQLFISILFIYLSLLLLKMGILIAVLPIVLLAVLGLELVATYRNLSIYLQRKRR